MTAFEAMYSYGYHHCALSTLQGCHSRKEILDTPRYSNYDGSRLALLSRIDENTRVARLSNTKWILASAFSDTVPTLGKKVRYSTIPVSQR